MPEERVQHETMTAQIADGTTTAASQDIRCCWRGDSRDHDEPPRASGWVTMCTSIVSDCCTTVAPMPSSKILRPPGPS